MPLSSKFFTESTGEKIVKIGQYLVKLTFRATLYIIVVVNIII